MNYTGPVNVNVDEGVGTVLGTLHPLGKNPPAYASLVLVLLDPATKQVITSTSPNANGYYNFKNILVGNYIISIAKGETATSPYLPREFYVGNRETIELDPGIAF